MTLAKWDTYHSYGMAFMTLVYFLLPSVLLFTVFSLLSFTALWITHWKDINHLKPPGGYPNYVTLFRFTALLVVTSFASGISNNTLAILLLILVLLDGVDGYLARRLKQRTEFGGLFDMETDALFVCSVSCILFEKNILPGWILVPAFIKFYYTVFTHLTGLSRMPEQRSLFGASVAVIMFLALILSLVIPGNFARIVAFSGSALICLSFLYSLGRAVIFRLRNA
jgi:phosphatidylglycerophosphate synthase